ncbi:MAG: hypothetical protein IJR92_03925 [Alphaproteobacteria bacterium]|nr:hypothetical protein [Alphaproteobacteria bacterium]
MKRIICALFGVVVSVSAFADGVKSGGVAGYRTASPEMWIPRSFFLSLSPNGNLTQAAIDAMLEKYDELAETEESEVGRSSLDGSYFIYKEGQNPLTVQDLNAICLAGGLTTKDDCRRYVVNPIREMLGRITYHNVCMGDTLTGGTNHCVDNVFVKDYTYNTQETLDQKDFVGKTGGYNPHGNDALIGGTKFVRTQSHEHSGNNQYAQDVNVSEWTAYGLAIEYARARGHSVICSSEISDDWIKCTTPDNKHYYSFKFASTRNTSDSTIEENVIRGICALTESNYVKNDCLIRNRTREDQCRAGCDVVCASGYASGKAVADMISKFSLKSSYNSYDNGANYCRMWMPGIWAGGDAWNGDIRMYPGYEYMSTAFREIQTVFDVNLIKTLRTYVELQGIAVNSFDCKYGTKTYADNLASGMAGKPEDVVTCSVNGTDVDFVFDDVYEGKEWAKEIGKSGMKCMLLQRKSGGSASFDGKYCVGPDKATCADLGKQISGGTHWDEEAGKCVLNDAATVKNIQTTVTVVGGTAFVVGMTVLSGGSLGFVFLEAGLGLGTDLAFEGINRFYETRPNKRATEFVEAAQACKIPDGVSECFASQKQCAKDAFTKFFRTLDEVVGDLNDEQLDFVDKAMANLGQCGFSDSEVENMLSASMPLTKDVVVGNLEKAVFIGGFIFNPKNVGAKWMRLRQARRVFKAANKTWNIEKRVLRADGMYVARLDVDGIEKAGVDGIMANLRRSGFYAEYDAKKKLIDFAVNDFSGAAKAPTNPNLLRNVGLGTMGAVGAAGYGGYKLVAGDGNKSDDNTPDDEDSKSDNDTDNGGGEFGGEDSALNVDGVNLRNVHQDSITIDNNTDMYNK